MSSLRSSTQRIQRLIDMGEGEMLDFKKEISSCTRIAKTMVSFANQQGGTLLIGVNDDGSINGVKPEEEKYMLDQAASHYCKPPIELTINEWTLGKKTVLEVIIPEGNDKPYYAIDEQGKGWVYIRQKDKSMLASKIMLEVIKRKSKMRNTIIKYGNDEQQLLEYLRNHNGITLDEASRLFKIKKWKLQRILINLLSVGVLAMKQGEQHELFYLN